MKGTVTAWGPLCHKHNTASLRDQTSRVIASFKCRNISIISKTNRPITAGTIEKVNRGGDALETWTLPKNRAPSALCVVVITVGADMIEVTGRRM